MTSLLPDDTVALPKEWIASVLRIAREVIGRSYIFRVEIEGDRHDQHPPVDWRERH